jgi:hypothetical protein
MRLFYEAVRARRSVGRAMYNSRIMSRMLITVFCVCFLQLPNSFAQSNALKSPNTPLGRRYRDGETLSYHMKPAIKGVIRPSGMRRMQRVWSRRTPPAILWRSSIGWD